MIIERLSQEHRNIRKLLAILEREIEIFEAGGQPDYQLIRSIVSYFEVYTEIYHHPQEDLVFARLKGRDPDAARRIGNLARAHRMGSSRLRKVAAAIDAELSGRRVLRQHLDAVVREFIAQERQHTVMEDRDFFPAALKALKPEDWGDIATAIDSYSDPMFSEAIEDRFRSVREYILRLEEEAKAERTRRSSQLR